jgi:hypothetical protein
MTICKVEDQTSNVISSSLNDDLQDQIKKFDMWFESSI